MTKQLLISNGVDAFICNLHGVKLGKFNKSSDAAFGDMRQDADGYVYTWSRGDLSRWSSAGVFQSILYTDPDEYTNGDCLFTPGGSNGYGNLLGLYGSNVYLCMTMHIQNLTPGFGDAAWPAEETQSGEIRTIPTDGSTITVQQAHMWAPGTRNIALGGQGYGGFSGIDIAVDGSVIYLVPNTIDTDDVPSQYDPSYAIPRFDPGTGMPLSDFLSTSYDPLTLYVRCLPDGTIATIARDGLGAFTLNIYDTSASLLHSYGPPMGETQIVFVSPDPFDSDTLWAVTNDLTVDHLYTFTLSTGTWALQGALSGDVAFPSAIEVLDVVAPATGERIWISRLL